MFTWGDPRLPCRIWTGFVVDENGCWVWQRYCNRSGYGNTYWQKRTNALVHRVVYETLVGPVPNGLQLDHLCRVRACGNPAHLEPVTARTNTLRGNSPTSRNAKKTHCPKGHLLGGDNVSPADRKRGSRGCYECVQATGAAWRAARKLEQRPAT